MFRGVTCLTSMDLLLVFDSDGAIVKILFKPFTANFSVMQESCRVQRNIFSICYQHAVEPDTFPADNVSEIRIEAYITADDYNLTVTAGLKCDAVDQGGGQGQNQAANRNIKQPTRMLAVQWDPPSLMCKVSCPFPVSMAISDRSVTLTTVKQCTMA